MVIKSVDRLTGLVPHGLTHILCFEKKKNKEKNKRKNCVFFGTCAFHLPFAPKGYQ